jgi:hypothetical protein
MFSVNYFVSPMLAEAGNSLSMSSFCMCCLEQFDVDLLPACIVAKRAGLAKILLVSIRY